MTLSTPYQVLQTFFGYAEFRANQAEIINSAVSGHDTLAILPTGGGKSLCFQIPALILPGITIVVSPLISLMTDQVETLSKKNVAAATINSAVPKAEQRRRLSLLSQNKYKLVYLSPERLHSPSTLTALKSVAISQVAVDEAHCISQWGHDFRPEYRQIADFVKQLPARPIITAVTATATPAVATDITTSLKMNSPQKFVASFARPNLNLTAKFFSLTNHKELALLEILRHRDLQSGIIYAATRRQTQEVAELITTFIPKLSAKVGFYHAGLSNHDRVIIQTKFMSSQLNIIVATNAFGMGIDKPDIRFVIHAGLPTSIEQYQQEVGRAGRDGLPADCYLLVDSHDLKVAGELIRPKIKNDASDQETAATDQLYQNRLTKFYDMGHFIQLKSCRHTFLQAYFGEKDVNECQNRCNNCQPQIPTEPALKKPLRNLRASLADRYDLPPTQILTETGLTFLCLLKPQTRAACLTIPSLGQGWLDQWYNTFQPLLSNPEPDA